MVKFVANISVDPTVIVSVKESLGSVLICFNDVEVLRVNERGVFRIEHSVRYPLTYLEKHGIMFDERNRLVIQ